jgi:hypothetical protein
MIRLFQDAIGMIWFSLPGLLIAVVVSGILVWLLKLYGPPARG